MKLLSFYMVFHVCFIVISICDWILETDRIVTLGLFHFIGPPNGYTCTLYIHSATTRLGGLVCYSRASFADPVNS